MIGALAGSGMTEYEAKMFASELEDGKILVGVHVGDNDRRKTAERVLEDSGAKVSTTKS